jgi:AcrR family transcriptional regulator
MKKDEMRELILGEAIHCFFKDGYEKASMREIASRVGVTQAAIYYHFHSKQEILYQLVDRTNNKLLSAFTDCLRSSKEPIEKLKDLICNQVLLIKTNIEEVKILVEDKKFLEGNLRRLVKEKEKFLFNLYRKHLEEAANAGKLKDIDSTVATFGIIGMINWLYHWYKPQGRLSIEELSDQIAKMAFFGIVKAETFKDLFPCSPNQPLTLST